MRLIWVTLCTAILLSVPLVASAVGETSDAMCQPWFPQCACNMVPGPNGQCVGGKNTANCPPGICTDTTNGFSTQGICAAAGKCQAVTTGGKGVDQGLQALGQILGKLMSALSSGSGSGSSSPSPTTSGCTSSYYYTSNSSLIGVDPCALYQAGATCTDTTATNYGASAACTYGTGATSSSSAQSLLDSLTGSTGTPTGSTGDTLTATPSSGSAPLAVTFSTIPSATDLSPFTINFGDGSSAQPLAEAACTSGAGSCTYQANYTYTTAGTFDATVLDVDGDTLSSATVTVTNPNGSTAGSSGLTQVLQNLGGLLAGTTTPQLPGTGQSSPNFPGVLGNILLENNGATIFASTVNSANNSESSSFFGSDTLGAQPQSVASQLCQNRPWASNFLADVIPPSFFDSLCQWGGYQVGQLPQQTAPTQPQVTLSQQAQTQQTTPAVQTQSTTTPAVPAQATITAEPASVPLGARTSIFWNSQGVTQCTETSPDGSFSENSLSGGAATVPITGPTTFSIYCLDPNGNPVTNDVTVEVSS
jgi:hypothetical protein